MQKAPQFLKIIVWEHQRGNCGREMYSDQRWRDNISKALKLERKAINKVCPSCGSTFKIERK